MRVMVMVKANKDSGAGIMPKEKLLAEMGKFNEEVVKAGDGILGTDRGTSWEQNTPEQRGKPWNKVHVNQ